jgi:hypothetical protein
MTVSRSELNAPEHLRGQFTKYTLKETRCERAEWILAAKESGARNIEISRALGISADAVSSIIDRWKERPESKTRYAITFFRNGLNMTHVVPLPTKAEAEAKIGRAYPGAIITRTERLGAS